jgi:hypothetical protein
VERMSGQDGVVVGVAPTSHNSERGGSFKGPKGEGSVGYCASGEIVRDGECVGRAHPFGEGDVVGVLVDMNSLAVGFYLNDRLQTRIPTCWSADEDAKGEDADAEELKVGSDDGKSRVRLSLRDQAMVAAVSLSPGTDEVVVIASEPPTACPGSTS